MSHCSFPGCDNPTRRISSKYCNGHYQQTQRGEELRPLRFRGPNKTPREYPVKLCSFPGCDNNHHGNGWCSGHFQQELKGKELTPLWSTRHPKTNSLEEDFNQHLEITEHGTMWTGTTNPKGYGRGAFDGKHFYAHRVAYALVYGPIPEGMEVDHDPECPKICVTPEHLTLRTKRDHALLGWERGELNGGWGTKRFTLAQLKETQEHE